MKTFASRDRCGQSQSEDQWQTRRNQWRGEHEISLEFVFERRSLHVFWSGCECRLGLREERNRVYR